MLDVQGWHGALHEVADFDPTIWTGGREAYPSFLGNPAVRCGVARSAAQARAARERVVRICEAAAGAASDARTLRRQLLDELRRALPFTAYAWLLTDPETSVGSSPLADVPGLPQLPRLIRLKYLTETNRWTRLDGSVALLSIATGGDLSRSRVWRELLSEYGVTDIASTVFEDQFGCWGFLDLWRADGPFTADDADFLASVAPPVTAALRRCQANTFEASTAATAPRRGPVVLLLSAELDVLAQTPETQEYLRVLVPPDGAQSPIPASAYNVAAQLLSVEAGVDGNPPTARVHLSAGRWLTLRAARIEGRQAPQGRDIAVSIEESSPSERAALFARAYGLTAREGELLGYLVTGSDTADLARRMYLSQHTVQDHLKSIFAKASVHNRRTLLSRALGT
jgi:DNA-binding CsgD family transcriptional regulator